MAVYSFDPGSLCHDNDLSMFHILGGPDTLGVSGTNIGGTTRDGLHADHETPWTPTNMVLPGS